MKLSRKQRKERRMQHEVARNEAILQGVKFKRRTIGHTVPGVGGTWAYTNDGWIFIATSLGERR